MVALPLVFSCGDFIGCASVWACVSYSTFKLIWIRTHNFKILQNKSNVSSRCNKWFGNIPYGLLVTNAFGELFLVFVFGWKKRKLSWDVLKTTTEKWWKHDECHTNTMYYVHTTEELSDTSNSLLALRKYFIEYIDLTRNK